MTLPKRTFHGTNPKWKLTKDQIFYLRCNFCLDGFRPDYGHPRSSRRFDMPFKNEKELGRAWKANRAHIIELAGEYRPHFAELDRLAGI